MKIFLIPLFILSSFQFVIAQDVKQNQLIVYGDAIIKAQTDIAIFTFAYKGVGASLDIAVNNAKNKIKQIIDELKKIGLNDKNFSTSYFYSGENQGDKAFLSSSRDYKAEIKVIVTIDSLQLLENSIITVSKNEPDYISEISFTLKDYSSLTVNVLEKARASAKEKAERLASKLGITLSNPLYIEDISLSPGLAFNSSSINVRGGRSNEVAYFIDGVLQEKVGTAFYSPEIQISSRVKVIYALQ